MFNPQDHDTTPRTFTPLAEGEYTMAVSEAQHSISQAGNPVLTLSIRVLIGPEADQEIRFQGYTISKKTSWRFAQLCKAIDPAMGPFDISDQRALNHALLNRPFVAKVEQRDETYLGKTRTKNEIRVHRAMTDDEREALKKALQGPTENDDIPF